MLLLGQFCFPRGKLQDVDLLGCGNARPVCQHRSDGSKRFSHGSVRSDCLGKDAWLVFFTYSN